VAYGTLNVHQTGNGLEDTGLVNQKTLPLGWTQEISHLPQGSLNVLKLHVIVCPLNVHQYK
jgi:hypothetical protein